MGHVFRLRGDCFAQNGNRDLSNDRIEFDKEQHWGRYADRPRNHKHHRASYLTQKPCQG